MQERGMNEQELKLEFEAHIIKIKQKILNYNRGNTSGRRTFSKNIKKEICDLQAKYHDKKLNVAKVLDLTSQTLDRWAKKKSTPVRPVRFKKLILKDQSPKAHQNVNQPSINYLLNWVLIFNHSVVLILLTLYLIQVGLS